MENLLTIFSGLFSSINQLRATFKNNQLSLLCYNQVVASFLESVLIWHTIRQSFAYSNLSRLGRCLGFLTFREALQACITDF